MSECDKTTRSPSPKDHTAGTNTEATCVGRNVGSICSSPPLSLSLLVGKVFGTKANYVIAECEYQEGEGEEEDEPDTQVSPFSVSPSALLDLCGVVVLWLG